MKMIVDDTLDYNTPFGDNGTNDNNNNDDEKYNYGNNKNNDSNHLNGNKNDDNVKNYHVVEPFISEPLS